MKNVLVPVMALAMALFTVSCSDDDCKDVKKEVKVVTSFADLAEMDLSANYVLASDITITGDWTPFAAGARDGNSADGTGFSGVFDGNGKTISGLTISQGEADDAIGLFGIIDGGTVKNLKLENVNINAADCENVGAVAGLLLNGGTVEGVTVSGTINAKRGNGGIVGRVIADGTVRNCTNNATITATGANAGGIVGAAYYTEVGKTMTIENCVNNGAVTSTSSVAGGIVGLSAADVKGCTNSGDVTGAGTSIGGIVAEQQNAGSVTGCVNEGDVVNNAGGYGNGGIVGWIRYTGAVESYPRKEAIEVTGNINRGSVSGGNDAGGIVGTVYNIGYINGNKNYAASLSGTAFAGGIVGNAQFTEGTPGMDAEDHVEVKNNLSTTAIENITGNCKDLFMYDNSSGAATVVEGNITEE